jgi:hypothetical protein
MSQAQLQAAIDFLKADKFGQGEDWEKAHQICQKHEGSPPFDWLHALVHRIEGDNANAAYWYRRAGKDRHTGSIEEEWQMIRQASEEV